MLVLPSLHGRMPVRTQLHEPRLALQGDGEGLLAELQAPPADRAHASPRGRREGQRGGDAAHEGGARS